MSSPEILARVERDHQNVVRFHSEAVGKANAIETRLDGIETRISEITQLRIAGTATDQDNAEFVLLTGDVKVLEKMLADAQQVVKVSGDDVHNAHSSYTNALAAHKRAQDTLEHMTLRDKCGQIEQMFLRCVAATHQAGKAIGHHSMGQSYQPSQALVHLIHYNKPPEL